MHFSSEKKSETNPKLRREIDFFCCFRLCLKMGKKKRFPICFNLIITAAMQINDLEVCYA